MKIGAKLKASLACDNQGKLYSWGSANSGLLGKKTNKNILIPEEVPFTYENTSYKVLSFSVGHFHVSAIAKRDEITKLPGDFNEAISQKHKTYEVLFKSFTDWYDSIFLSNIKINAKSFLRMILRLSFDMKFIDYKLLEANFLQTFYSYLSLEKKDVFKMEKFYKKIIKSELEIPENKEEIDFSRFERILEGKNKHIIEMQKFILSSASHFIQYPDDVPYFIKFVCQFKSFVGLNKLKKIFEYSLFNPEEYFNPKDFDQFSKVCSFFNEIKISSQKIKETYASQGIAFDPDFEEEDYLVETNILIDCIINKRTGLNVLFSWGYDTEGRLGFESKDYVPDENKTTTNGEQKETDYIGTYYSPKLVSFPSVQIKIINVCCSYSHSLALSHYRNIYSWGSGKFGCLGQKTNSNCPTPKLIEIDIDGKPFGNAENIACGMYYSMSIHSDGTAYSWGCGNSGRLGHGDESSVEAPKLIEYFKENDITIMVIKCGDTHSAAISSGKELYTWGCGNNGMLGHGNFIDRHFPCQVDFFSNIKIDDVFLGSGNGIVLTSDNRVFAWGKNSNGMLGIPSMINQNILIPAQVIFEHDEEVSVNLISIGTLHTIFLMTNGTCFTCGNSLEGCLGIVDAVDKIDKPTQISSEFKFYISEVTNIKENSIFSIYNDDGSLKIPSTKVACLTYVHASVNNSAFVTNKGDLYMTGEDTLMIKPKKEKQVQVNLNSNFKIQKAENNKKKTFYEEITKGDNIKGTENTGEYTWNNEIIKINCIEISEKVSSIVLSKNHAICIARARAYTWGYNHFGKLGLPNKAINEFVDYPTYIDKVGNNIKMAAVSDTHSLVLGNNGEIYAFGQNMYGKLGIGNFSKYYNNENIEKMEEPYEAEPQQVKNITFADYISCSNTHSACIMKLDHNYENYYKIFTWGSGFSGKLGLSNFDDYYEPQLIEYNDMHDSYFVIVVLGSEFSAALDLDGNIWAWGRKKNIGFYNDYDVKNDFLTRPKMITKDIKFKYISANDSGIVAIDITGAVYAFGKFNVSGKIKYLKFEKSPYNGFQGKEGMDYPAMTIAVAGNNHFLSICDSKKYPYSWGNNLFYKCGQKFTVTDNNGLTVESIFHEEPKRIEYFLEVLNNELSNNDPTTIQLEKYDAQLDTTKIKKNKIQKILLDEKTGFKNIGLLKEDIRIHKLFYDTMNEFISTMKEVEKEKEFYYLNVENKIISVINKSTCPKITTYKSEIPKIINLNFQIYEAFIALLQIHPCYFSTVLSDIKNSKTFVPIVKTVFGKNIIHMRNKRTIFMLLGLWNSIFEKEKMKIKIEADRFDDLITYELYHLIFQISIHNNLLILDIISEVIILYISEICANPNTGLIELTDDCDIISIYKDLGSYRNIINYKVCKVISRRLVNVFLDLNKGTYSANQKSNSFSFGVFWILKQISNLFSSEIIKPKQDSEYGDQQTTNTTREGKTKAGNTNRNENNKTKSDYLDTPDDITKLSEKDILHPFNRTFDFFIFTPFVEVIKQVRDSKEDTNSPFSILLKSMIKNLEAKSNQEGFSQLYNLYISDKIKCENLIFKKVLSPKNEIMNQISELFTSLSKGDLLFNYTDEKLFIDLPSSKKEIINLNLICRNILNNYEYDFSLLALKELIINNIENYNKPIVVAISIKDLIDIQITFLSLLNNKELHDNDPLKLLLYQLSSFKINELESSSNIRNFVLNFYIKPNCFIYQNDDCKLLRCDKCKLPIPDVFFQEQDISNTIEGTSWVCNNIQCEAINDKSDVQCTNCKTFKNSDPSQEFFFFNRYKVINDEEIIQTYENTLFCLPQLNTSDDIEKEVNSQIAKISSIKETTMQDKETLSILKKFINDFGNCLTGSEESANYMLEKIKLISKWDQKLEENIHAREEHSKYLESIRDFLVFIVQSAENSKLEVSGSKKGTGMLIYNIKQGYCNQFARDSCPISKLEIGDYKSSSVLKKFSVAHLIKEKVIDEILFNDAKQEKLENKTNLFFEKKNNGYEMRLVYKEINRKYLLCGVNKHEYLIESHFLNNEALYELRRISRTNSTFNTGGIRFNSFYLIKLINSLEND